MRCYISSYYKPHNHFLYPQGTLEDNLLYPRHSQAAGTGEGPQQQSLHRALTAVGADGFVDSLRRGEVRDWAKSTSPGERQRLAVARAIVPRPPLVMRPFI